MCDQFAGISFALPLTGVFICGISFDGRLKRLNPTWTSELDWTEEELRSRPLVDFIHPSDREITRLGTSGDGPDKMAHFVNRFQTRCGTWRWLDWSTTVAPSSELIYAFARDITDQKEAEAALQESELRTRQIIETARDAFIAIDANGLITDWNPQAEATFGWSHQEAIGGDVIEMIIPQHSRVGLRLALTQFAQFGAEGVRFGEPLDLVSRNFDIGEPFEVTALHRDGREFPIEFTVSPVRTSRGFSLNAFLRDISSRRESEEMVEHQRQQLLEAQSVGGFGSWEWDPTVSSMEISEEVFRIWGVEPSGDPVTFQEFLQRTHPDERQLQERMVRAALTNGDPFSLEHRIVRPDGTVRTVFSRGRTIRGSDGRSRMLGMVQDITDRRGAEETLAASEARIRQIIETAHDAFLAMNARGEIVDWSPRAESLFGWSAQEAIGRSLIDTIIPGRDRKDRKAGLKRCIDGGAPELFGRVVEQTVLHRDGHEFPVEFIVSALGAGEDTCFNVFLRDVTERNRALELARQHERLAAVGQLAAGLAHDFNNMISAISVCAELLTAQALDDAGAAHLNAIRQQAEQATALVWQLLDFARHGSLKPSEVDLAEFLADWLPVLRRTLGQEALISVMQDGGPHKVRADPLRLQQILMNLVLNSRDAMEAPGTFGIALSCADCVDEETATPQNRHEGPWVRIDVTDSGGGIPDDLLGKVFEPFFTTKPIGRGTGLGLAQVYGLVAQQQGHVALRSSPAGTTVSIWFPALGDCGVSVDSPKPETATNNEGPGDAARGAGPEPRRRESANGLSSPASAAAGKNRGPRA